MDFIGIGVHRIDGVESIISSDTIVIIHIIIAGDDHLTRAG